MARWSLKSAITPLTGAERMAATQSGIDGYITPDTLNGFMDPSVIPFENSGFTSNNVYDAIVEAATDGGSVSSVNGDTGVVIVAAPIIIACSDETTALTTGTAKVTFRMPYAFTLTAVRASVTTAPTGSVLTVDINESGSTILSTKITIDATEKTSTTAATPPVISDSSLADDAEITIDIDTVGSTIAGAGLKVMLIGYAT